NPRTPATFKKLASASFLLFWQFGLPDGATLIRPTGEYRPGKVSATRHNTNYNPNAYFSA
ncbi:hypothetical protein, partial [Salmonella enterica]